MPDRGSFFMRQRVQLIVMIILLGVFLLMVYTAMDRFYAIEKFPHLLPNLPQQEAQLTQGAARVSTGIYIKNFNEFNIHNNSFEVEANVWFKFDPNQVSLETIKKFQFEHGTIVKKSDPKIRMIGSKVSAVFDTRIRFTSHLIHRTFPFADHRIFLIMKLVEVSPDDLYFEAKKSNFRISKNVKPLGWQLKNFESKAGYIKEPLSIDNPQIRVEQPRLIYAFEFKKPGFRNVSIILGPGIFLFFFALVSLLIQTQRSKQDSRSVAPIQIAMGSITGLLVLRFVVESLSPSVGYFTIIDYFYSLVFIAIFIILLVNVYDYNRSVNYKFKVFLFYTIQFFILGAMGYFMGELLWS